MIDIEKYFKYNQKKETLVCKKCGWHLWQGINCTIEQRNMVLLGHLKLHYIITTDEVKAYEILSNKYDFIPKATIESKLMIRLKNQRWTVAPRPAFVQACNEILDNNRIKYVEFISCGIKYRMIRIKDIAEYNIKGEIKPEWILDPEDIK